MDHPIGPVRGRSEGMILPADQVVGGVRLTVFVAWATVVTMAVRTAGTHRLSLALVSALALALIAPLAASGSTGPSSTSTHTAPAAKAFVLDLSRRGDFVAQSNFVQCVGASMQMMLNMIEPSDDRSASTQRRLQALARNLSGQRPDGRQRKGASVRGWTSGLNSLSAGPYRTVGEPDLQAALRIAAKAMRDTGRPVGLLVWRGRHAWVMAGFSATADPAKTDDFTVTRVIVMDPLYPYGSKVWGPSPKPREAISVATLGRQFVPRNFRTGGQAGGGTETANAWSQSLNGKYVIVMPYTPTWSAAVRR